GALFVGPEAPPVALHGRRSIASALVRPDDFAVNVTEAKELLARADDGDELAAFVRRTTLEAYATADRLTEAAPARDGAAYPASEFAGRLRLVARLLKSGFGARVYYTLHVGFDTHAQQLVPHFGLLNEFAVALAAFFDDLAAAKLAERVVVLAFSEFGRT